MFSNDKLGLIAYLNDHARAPVNRALQRLDADAVDRILDAHLSQNTMNGNDDEAKVLRSLNDRPASAEDLERTTARASGYLKMGIRIVTFWDPRYPISLKMVPNAPLVLYVNGCVFPGSSPVAVVGTVNPSDRGMELAYHFGAALAKRKRTVISGLAKGIDTEAHGGALSVGGTTIAVLGTPVTDIYPEENKALAEEIGLHGSVVSEVTEEATSNMGRFLQRYRIISGMAESVVFVETSGEGAARRQVEVALKQGRKVFVVEHEVFTNPEHKAGFERLKTMGAVPIYGPEDLTSKEPRQSKLFY